MNFSSIKQKVREIDWKGVFLSRNFIIVCCVMLVAAGILVFSVAGGKTGTTLAAGACLALAAGDSGGNLFYSIVLKSANHASLYPDVNAVLEKIPRQH